MSTPPFVHESLAEIPEDKLVDRIVTDILWGREFFQFYGMPSGMVSRQCVSLNTAPGNPKGDIDVLFCAPDFPEQAVAYQIKRIKLGVNQLRNGTPGKLQEFKKLTQQANLLAEMGFWQVYADAIVVVDAREQNAREQNAGKVTFEGLSSEMRGKVESAVSSAIQLFDTRVGFGVMEFIQTMDSAPFTVGTHGLHVRRFAKPTTQSEELTKWVTEVFSKPARVAVEDGQ
ncbi:MAG: hypothetical protein ACLQBK_12030 [Candidatus Sulfotelmatobacter sp.]